MIPSHHSCNGCSLCALSCPVHCIDMRPDDLGFLYPHVQPDACLHCGLCQRICPENADRRSRPFACFFMCNQDERIVRQSSSGGIFSALALQTLHAQGVVVGAAFDQTFNVILTHVSRKQDLPRLQSSKYVQASIPATLFPSLRAELATGRPVLFTGTPCHIAAFKAFLKNKDYPNLLLVDVICHGTPAPAVWQSYLKHTLQSLNATPDDIQRISFRDKQTGWKNFSFALTLKNSQREIHETHQQNPYLQLFLKDLTLRKACSHCTMKNGSSGADLTLGDFWNLKKLMPEQANDTGASMVLCFTDKGRQALKALAGVTQLPVPNSFVWRSNKAFSQSTAPHQLATAFAQDFKAHQGVWFDPSTYLVRKRKKKFWGKLWHFLSAWFSRNQ